MYQISEGLLYKTKKFYEEAKTILNPKTVTTAEEIEDAIRTLFKKVNGTVSFPYKSKRYVQYSGHIGVYAIGSGLYTDGFGCIEAVEDITTFYYKNLGGKSHYTPDFIDFLEGRKPRNGSEFEIV